MKNKILFVFWMVFVIASGSQVRATTLPAKEDSVESAIAGHVKAFRALPKKERKARLRSARNRWKEYQKAPRQSGDAEIIFLAIVAILLPPLAVVLKENKVSRRFWICLLLSLLFLLPGIVYALLIVFGVI